MNRLSSTFAITTLGALVAACGGLSGDTQNFPELATLNGKLTNDSSVQTVTTATPNGDVRVAVVWVGEIAKSYNVAVDVAVKPVFPAEFQISLNSAPPDSTIATNKNASTSGSTDEVPSEGTPTNSGSTSTGGTNSGTSGSSNASIHTQNFAQTDWPDGFGIAVGSVVAYQDLNGNGKLDLVDATATQYVDRVLGANDELLLVYVQGDVPNVVDFLDDAGKLPQKGYNLYRIKSCSAVLSNSGDASCKASATWLSMDTIFDIALSDDPRFSQLMCKTESGFDSATSGTTGNSSGGGSGGTTVVADDAGKAPDVDGGAQVDASADGGAPTDAGAASDADASASADGGVGPANPSYPASNDPNLVCVDNGNSFYVNDCQTSVPTAPTGLCSPTSVTPTACSGVVIPLPSPTPSNWPCPIQ